MCHSVLSINFSQLPSGGPLPRTCVVWQGHIRVVPPEDLWQACTNSRLPLATLAVGGRHTHKVLSTLGMCVAPLALLPSVLPHAGVAGQGAGGASAGGGGL